MAAAGYRVLYVGHEGHDEAVGTIAEAPECGDPGGPGGRPGRALGAAIPPRVALLAQTTLGHHEWEGVLAAASGALPRSVDGPPQRPLLRHHQPPVRRRGPRRAGRTWSWWWAAPTPRTPGPWCGWRGPPGRRPTASKGRSPSTRPGSPGVAVVGVTAGASAPDGAVQAVVDALAPTGGVEVVRVTTEEEYFPPPPQLRALLAALQAAVEGGCGARYPGRPRPAGRRPRLGRGPGPGVARRRLRRPPGPAALLRRPRRPGPARSPPPGSRSGRWCR